jgi:uronate dehydrogenase
VSATVLVTGAAGRVAAHLRAHLPAAGFVLRGFDRRPISGEPRAACADINDLPALRGAMAGCDAVVHLAGAVRPSDTFEDVLEANIAGTYHVFEAARLEGVGRVVLASSHHANGFAPRSARSQPRAGDRPDSYYGVSKLFEEDLGRLYHDRYAMAVACIRIGSCFERPPGVRGLSTWLSPRDCAGLFAACLRSAGLGYAVVYGISRNTRRFWDLQPALALGYEPLDDAEAYAPEILAEHGGIDPSTPEDPQGGPAAWVAGPSAPR